MSDAPEVTQLLARIRSGDRSAFEVLFPLLYETMRGIARQHLGGADGKTIAPTVLVHEAYLKLCGANRLDYTDRAHFLASCSRVMRNLIVDDARARQAQKRGGGLVAVTLDEGQLGLGNRSEELLALDEALQRLESLDPRLARVVECRYFAGLDEEETAAALEVTSRTVRRDWVKARGLLRRMLE